jgi:Cdc6-like AAA superfamily ATPase
LSVFWGDLEARAAGFFFGAVAFWAMAAKLEPGLAERFGHKKSADGFSDVRRMAGDAPPVVGYEKLVRGAKKRGSVVLGATASGVSEILFEDFKKKNLRVMGAPGSGKGVFAQMIFGQIFGHVKSVVFDPKQDEYLTAFFAEKGARFVDLAADVPQIDVLAGATPREVSEALSGAFGLEPTGKESDVYTLEELAAVEAVARGGAETLDALGLGLADAKARKIASSVRLLAGLEALRGGESLETLFKNEGVYFVFDESSQSQKFAARLIFTRLIQLKKSRRVEGHLTVFLDEMKHFVTKKTVDSLGLMRSRGVNFIVAHQSQGDFEGEFSDVTGAEAKQRIFDNCQIQLVYRQTQDAEFWAKLSGDKVFAETLTGEELNEASASIGGAEVRRVERQRPAIDKNEFLTLPDGVGVLFFVGPDGAARKLRPAPPPVALRGFEVRRVERAPVAPVAAETAAPIDGLPPFDWGGLGLADAAPAESVPLSAGEPSRNGRKIEEVEL